MKLSHVLRPSALALALLAYGCGAPQALVEDIDTVTAASAEGDFAALVAAGDAAWEERGDLEQIRAAIAAWEEAITVDTGDEDRRAALYPVYCKLAQGWYWLAHGHLKWDDSISKDELIETYETGATYGMEALALNNDAWTEALERGSIADASVNLQESDVPAIYWYSSNMGRVGLLRGIVASLRYADDIRAMMDRAIDMNPTYYYNAPSRYFGVLRTKLPFPGGDMEASQNYFESAVEANPEYLETRVLYAEEWALAAQEREIFVEQLTAVLEADIEATPALLPENANAQRRAQELMNEVDELFR